MTVGELIALLQKLSPDIEIGRLDWISRGADVDDWSDVSDIDEVLAPPNEHSSTKAMIK